MLMSIRKPSGHMEKEMMNFQVSDYFPLIIKTVSEVTGRYVELENSIELSVALEKFVTVQSSYDPSKGPFLPYMKQAIRNAVIDYLKSENRRGTVSLDHMVDFQQENSDIYDAAQLKMYEKQLKKYGLTYEKLAEKAPIHYLTRKKLVSLAKSLSEDDEVVGHLRHKKRLPITMISTKYDMTVKVVKTHKLYIIALIVAYVEAIEPVVNWIEEQCCE